MSARHRKSPAEVQAAFDALFDSFSDAERLEQEGRMIGFAFLSEVEHELDRRGKSRKDLAKAMGVSGSFLTQLFTGDKPLSDKHKAMFQRALGIRFVVSAQQEAAYAEEPSFQFPGVDRTAVLRIVRDFEPDYGSGHAGRPDYNENVAA
jgi:ribosome-binding protein aMBF1 (putative translation factor)